ncbi:MAG: HDIG domain-containing protein [Flavobacteriales bacterium]|nr:HDIG domain-containing protein [Flavobacteriales bacterium]
MSGPITYLRDKHALILKFMLFILTIAMIVYLLPREGKFKYELSNMRGKPWPYEELIASFSFPILKTQKEIENEREAIKASSLPYYNLDESIADKARTLLEERFEEKWNEKSRAGWLDFLWPNSAEAQRQKEHDRLLGQARKVFKEIYSRGVIRMDERLENKNEQEEIFLVKRNVAEEIPWGELLTLRAVPSFVSTALENQESSLKEFLQPLIEDVVVPNVFFDENKTTAVLEQEINAISTTRGAVQEGQRILSRGEVVDDQKMMILESMKAQVEAQLGGASNYYYILSGQIILVTLSMLVLSFFLIIFRRDIIVDNIQLAFLLLLVILMVGCAAWVVHSGWDIYLVPFCFLPIVVRAFFDNRLAFFTHLTAVLISSIISSNGFEFVFLQFIAGNAAIYSLANMRNRSQYFISAVVVFVSYSITYLGILAIQEGATFTVNNTKFQWFGVSAASILLAYPMIYLFEKIFGLVSDVTLMELADLNSPLLRRLSTEAPGTFQHSLQVANLAEEAIHAIGGDTLLVRTGALYHDVGKMKDPAFFIENQVSGVNPHDDIPEAESARIIIGHVIHGVELARKHKLPEKVIDFIRSHHGTTRTEFFIRRYKEKYPDKTVDMSLFTYPGPKPFSKETSVLMMSDACEAASRSLKKPDKEKITKLVNGIIDGQVAGEQFSHANITLKDIAQTKKIIIRRLLSIHHVRVEYPTAVATEQQ